MRFQCILLVILSLLINMDSVLGNGTYQRCESPQYVEFGTKGIVHCNFTDDYFGIYWYNTTDYVNDFSLINIKNPGSTKHGPGFTSGDFDVYPNGSLIIRKVNFGNAHNYSVVKLDSPSDVIIAHYVDVIVVALPTPPYPVIKGCNSQQTCVMKVGHRGNLTCSLKGITPPVDLEWRSIEDDSSVTFIHHQQNTTRSEDGRYQVVLTSTFYLDYALDYSSNVECRVSVPEKGPKFDLRSSLYLLVTGANGQTTPPNGEKDVEEFPVAVIVVVLVAVVLIVIITSVVYIKRKGHKPKTEVDYERVEAPTKNETVQNKEYVPLLESEAKAELFKKHLKKTYKDSFGSLVVISPIKDGSDIKETAKIIESEVTMQTEPKKAFTSVENANDSNFLTDGGDNNVSAKQVDEKAMGEKRSNEVQMPTSALDSKKPEVEIVSKENTNAAPSTMNVTNTDEVDNSGYIEHKLLIEPVIQGLNVRPGIESQGIWENVGSVSDVLTDPKIASKCFIVEGEFGYEMSTISKLLAREWSMEEESELAKCFKVLVVLKCNQISGDQPIYAEIRRLLSITDAALAENDIRGVLCDEHNKVALVLDGLNMYTGAETKINDSLKRIITRQSLKECSVIIITSTPCALNDLKDFTRLRALNLTEKDQESLIRKEIVCRNADTEEQIRTLVKENVLLKDILRIPFFFLFFLRRACVLTYLPKFDSVTSFFMWIISELSRQCPLQHREYSADMWKDEAVAELGKLAFEALTSKHKWGKNWSKSELLTRLNEDAYKFYQQIGIIREEMLPTRDLSSAKLKNGSANLEARTRFTHSLFYEWYAAQHLKTMFKSQDSHYMKGILNILSTTDCWYCIRFFCGIDDEHSREVCETVKHKALQLLCKIESEEGLTNIQDVKKFWPKQMSLSVGDSRVQQLATVQLLEVGSKKEFQTLNLKLENCFNSVKDGSSLLELKSGVQLPALANLKQLDVSEDDRELTNEETTGILKFALKSTKLKDVRFLHCILPQTLGEVNVDGTIKVKDIKVQWTPHQDSSDTYSLDWKTCTWKAPKGGRVDDYVYKNLVTEFRDNHGIRVDVRH